MAKRLAKIEASAEATALTHPEWLPLLLDRELSHHRDRRLLARLRCQVASACFRRRCPLSRRTRARSRLAARPPGLIASRLKCEKLSSQRGAGRGRHHVGAPGDIISERPGDFIGIRSIADLTAPKCYGSLRSCEGKRMRICSS